MSVQQHESAGASRRTTRRLRPEVAAQWAARRREQELKSLYQTPVEELSPDDIAKMRAAFLRGV